MDSSLSHDLTLSPPSGSGRSCTSALGRGCVKTGKELKSKKIDLSE